ncbi:hypothetical protein BV25DRAFT_1963945 [Artomyces pyxidatus]|uniref:Uncharacterized protein n=1 Tax=Artomyces pyxidatus TaxID=48021 RepID=A0ACB8SRG9_9AGAM|nr:hypothetical protein BV25DRAFT_1963945 [Artomyces pyxidatus]
MPGSPDPPESLAPGTWLSATARIPLNTEGIDPEALRRAVSEYRSWKAKTDFYKKKYKDLRDEYQEYHAGVDAEIKRRLAVEVAKAEKKYKDKYDQDVKRVKEHFQWYNSQIDRREARISELERALQLIAREDDDHRILAGIVIRELLGVQPVPGSAAAATIDDAAPVVSSQSATKHEPNVNSPTCTLVDE